MAEQKIVQHRRDSYSNYAPSKLKPGEIVMIQSGDPNSSSGKGVYACVAAGDVLRLATQDELSTYDQAAQTAAEDAAQLKADVQTIKTQIDEEISAAQASAQSAETAKTDTLNLKDQVAAQVTAAQTAAQNAQTALESVQSKEAEISDILIHNSHKIEVGNASTDVNGEMYIYLSDDFKDVLGSNVYRVFLQEEGQGKVYVSEKTDTFFVVSGTENLAFSWLAII